MPTARERQRPDLRFRNFASARCELVSLPPPLEVPVPVPRLEPPWLEAPSPLSDIALGSFDLSQTPP